MSMLCHAMLCQAAARSGAVVAAPAAAPASVSANRPKRAARKPELFEAGSCTELTRLMAQAPHSLT